MKTLRLIGAALIAVVFSFTFSSCSDDDDDSAEVTDSLVGTTWKIITCTDPDLDVGTFFTFNSDGSITSNHYDDEPDPYNYFIKYTYDGTTLTINFSNDDCITGAFIINGNSATYSYYWYDYDYKWTGKDDPDRNHVATLSRQ